MTAARKVVTRSPKRNVGLVNCPWFQAQPIEHESRLEKHFVLRAMLFGGLQSIQHQPFQMPLKIEGARYTPDFLLAFGNGDHLVFEVKRSERIKALKGRFDEIADLCKQSRLHFFVVHQGQIEGQRRAERACLIRRYAMSRVDPKVINQVVICVCQARNGVAIKRLMKQFDISYGHVLALVAQRHVSLHKGLLISDDDLLFPRVPEIKNAAVQFGSWFGCAPWGPAPGVPQAVG